MSATCYKIPQPSYMFKNWYLTPGWGEETLGGFRRWKNVSQLLLKSDSWQWNMAMPPGGKMHWCDNLIIQCIHGLKLTSFQCHITLLSHNMHHQCITLCASLPILTHTSLRNKISQDTSDHMPIFNCSEVQSPCSLANWSHFLLLWLLSVFWWHIKKKKY